jgi:sulfur carrier protein
MTTQIKSASSCIEVSFNAELKIIETMTLLEWLDQIGVMGDAIATAINGQFIPKHKRGEIMLKHGDQIITFKPIVGG